MFKGLKNYYFKNIIKMFNGVNKKILIFGSLGLLLILMTIGLLIFVFYGKSTLVDEKQGIQKENSENIDIGKSASEKNKIQKIISFPVLSSVLSLNQESLLSVLRNGDLITTDFSGQNQVNLFNISQKELSKIIWSDDKKKLIKIEYDREKEEINKAVIDISGQKEYLLPSNVQSVNFFDDNNLIFHYLGAGDGVNILASSGFNFDKFKDLFRFNFFDVNFDVLNINEVLLYDKPSGLIASDLYLASIKNQKLEKILSLISGFTLQVSPDKEKIIYSATNEHGRNLSLKLFDLKNNSDKNLEISTLPEKCAFIDYTSVVCAIPTNLTGFYIMPDDYYKKKIMTIDKFIRINLLTGEQMAIADVSISNLQIDAVNLFVSPDQKYLFFINQRDGGLYRLEF